MATVKESAREIQVMVTNLDRMERGLAQSRMNAQETLRSFVTDTDYPIDVRYDIWSKWCDKTHNSFDVNTADLRPFVETVTGTDDPQSVEDSLEWLIFLELFCKDTDQARMLCQQYNIKMNDAREVLIKTNFRFLPPNEIAQ